MSDFLNKLQSTTPHDLISDLKDPSVQYECLELIKRDSTPVIVFLKNSVLVNTTENNLDNNIFKNEQFKLNIINMLVDCMYTMSDFNFNVFLTSLVDIHYSISIEVVNDRFLGLFRGQNNQNETVLLRYLKFLKYFMVFYENKKRTDEVFTDLDKTVRMSYKLIIELIERVGTCKSQDNSFSQSNGNNLNINPSQNTISKDTLKSTLSDLLVDVIHSMIYQDLHHILEDHKFIETILRYFPHSVKLVQLISRKYPEFVDWNGLIRELLTNQRNEAKQSKSEILDLILKKTSEINQENVVLIKEFVIKECIIGKEEIVQMGKEEYLKSVLQYDTYRGHVHGLVRRLFVCEKDIDAHLLEFKNLEQDIAISSDLDRNMILLEIKLFIAAVTKINLTNSDQIYVQIFNNQNNNLNNSQNNLNSQTALNNQDSEFLKVTFYRFAISNKKSQYPFDYSSAYGKLFSYYKCDEFDIAYESAADLDLFVGSDEVSVFLMRCAVYQAYCAVFPMSENSQSQLETVEKSDGPLFDTLKSLHSTNSFSQTKSKTVEMTIKVLDPAFLANIAEFLIKTLDCTDNVKVFWYLFDILVISKSQDEKINQIVDGITRGSVEELYDLVVYYLLFKRKKLENSDNFAMIQSIDGMLKSIKHSCKPELSNFIAFTLNESFQYFPEFLFVQTIRSTDSYELTQDNLEIKKPICRALSVKEDILLYLSSSVVEEGRSDQSLNDFFNYLNFYKSLIDGGISPNMGKYRELTVIYGRLVRFIRKNEIADQNVLNLKEWLEKLPKSKHFSVLLHEWPVFLKIEYF